MPQRRNEEFVPRVEIRNILSSVAGSRLVSNQVQTCGQFLNSSNEVGSSSIINLEASMYS